MSVPAPPSLGGFWDSVKRVTMNRCDLRYLYTGARHARCAAPPGAGAAGVLRPAAAPPEYRAVRGDRPDLPGHGESRAPRAHHTAAYFTEAIAGFLEAAGSAAPSPWRSPHDSRGPVGVATTAIDIEEVTIS
jgi:hypothetical protein